MEAEREMEKVTERRAKEEETEWRKSKPGGSGAGSDAETVTGWMDWTDITPGEKLRTNVPTLAHRVPCP